MSGSRWKHGIFMLAEMSLRLAFVPGLRAAVLRLLGARVGRNVRVYECRFVNLWAGFSNLVVGDDVHIGPACLIDLSGPVRIGNGSTISPRVSIISHNDPGSAHGSRRLASYPCDTNGVSIGAHCWVGTAATLLSGSVVEDDVVVGAMSLVRGRLNAGVVYGGVPARPLHP